MRTKLGHFIVILPFISTLLYGEKGLSPREQKELQREVKELRREVEELRKELRSKRAAPSALAPLQSSGELNVENLKGRTLDQSSDKGISSWFNSDQLKELKEILSKILKSREAYEKAIKELEKEM